MTTGEPRGLRGIDEAILEAACLAARRSGLSVSDWLDESIARRAAAGTAAGRTLRGDIDEDALATAIEDLTRRIRGMDENARAVFTDLQARLDEIAARLGAAAGARRRGAHASLTEIAGIVADLSRDIDDADETARSTIEGIRAGRGQSPKAGHASRVTAAIRSLDQRLSSISDASRSPREAAPLDGLGAIKARVEALLAEAPEATSGTGSEATPGTLESDLEEVKSLLFGDFSGEDFSALASAQRQMSDSLASLHDELSAVAQRLAAVPDPVRATPDDSADRLDDIEDEIAALRRTVEAEEGPRAIGRLEMRTSELIRVVEQGLAAAEVTSRAGTEDVIRGLDARFDTVATRIDAALDQANPREGLSQITDAIDKISRDLNERHFPGAAETGTQVAALARKLDAMQASDGIEKAVKELEGQVARLASGLERPLPKAADLEAIEAQLSQIHELLSSGKREAAEVARKAAREAAETVATRMGGKDLVKALEQGLEDIRRASSKTDERTQQVLSAVEATLGRVVDRLPREEKTVVAYEAYKATGTYGAEIPLPRTEQVSTGVSLSRSEPDAARPDLAALRELARSAAHGARDKTKDRKADFIAAARRAAKAAAGEEPSPVTTDVEERKPGTFARISQAIRSRRRTLLGLALASVMVAAAAAHLLGGGGVSMLDGRSIAAVSEAGSVNEAGDQPKPAAAPVTAPPSSAAHNEAGPRAEKPSTDKASAFAFAAPERLDSRFDDMPLSPPTRAFARISLRAASLPFDEAIGSEALRQAAAAGNPDAAVEVAARYAEGRHVPRDVAAAALWYEAAAEAGSAVAQNRLASLYERGHGVAKNPAVAAAWYRRAAKQGNVGAMHNLGVMLSGGIEGDADYGEAAQWFRAAAEHDVEDSQYNLGVIYARGLGLDRDLAESYKWFALAAAEGDAEATARLDEVGEALSPDDLAKARAAVAAWRPKPASARANAVALLPDSWRGPSDGITAAERRSLVMKIQALLAEQGYDPGPADGLEGPKTRQAVLAFQRNIGLTETGKISNDVVAALADPAG